MSFCVSDEARATVRNLDISYLAFPLLVYLKYNFLASYFVVSKLDTKKTRGSLFLRLQKIFGFDHI